MAWSVLCVTVMDNRRASIPLERMTVEEMLACIEPFTTARPEELEALVVGTRFVSPR